MALSVETRFGKLLRDLRRREKLSQIKLAALLGVDDSTINKLEAGSRKPPRDPKFYGRLREVPGFTESEITLLLQAAEYAPAWLSQSTRDTTQQQTIEELGVTLNVTLQAATMNLNDDDVDELRGLVEKDLRSLLHHFMHRKYERDKILKEQSVD
jgi:transcriptional regulator with XRE-family HTH domain